MCETEGGWGGSDGSSFSHCNNVYLFFFMSVTDIVTGGMFV